MVHTAADDLERICQRIDLDSPEAARRAARTIYNGCGSLKNFPNLGRVSIRMSGRRELIFRRCLTSSFIR